ASSADLVCSIHQNAVSFLHWGHSMFVVGSASTVASPSITLSEASEPVFCFSATSFLPSPSPFLALKPHLGQLIISSPGAGLRRVSHFGQKRNLKKPRYFLRADLTMLEKSFEYSVAEVEASCITSIGSFLFVVTLIM